MWRELLECPPPARLYQLVIKRTIALDLKPMITILLFILLTPESNIYIRLQLCLQRIQDTLGNVEDWRVTNLRCCIAYYESELHRKALII